jgi:biopolymer transport protein ExbB
METPIDRISFSAPQRRQSLFKVLGAALLMSLLLPASAFAWWNHDWSYRKQITLDTGAQGANVSADLSNVPVLIRLHDGNLRFADAAADGADLRFVADDDKTPLKFHIEKYDSVFNLAFVWVDVPVLKAGAATHLWLYYGNPKATSASDPKGTYDASQVLVYHFAQRGMAPQDATAYANNATTLTGVDESALIGLGAKFDSQVVALPASPSLQTAAGAAYTWSLWVKPAAPSENAVLYARHDGTASVIVGLANGVPYVAVTDGSGSVQRAQAAQPLAEKGWHQIAVTGGAQTTLYVDGAQAAQVAAPTPALNSVATLGGDGGLNGAAPASPFSGEMDELDIAKVARDPALIRLLALNEGEADKLVSFGNDEQQSSWSTGYVGILLHSVTLDGWVIICILMVMAVISWLVMVAKAGQIRRVSKANDAFLDLFRAVEGDFGALSHIAAGTAAAADIEVSESARELMQQSPLMHLFNTGVAELRGRLSGDNRNNKRRMDLLSTQSIEAIRASLDSSLIQETQSLNRLMVLLTIAISGGPFIGLLGTVVGVMITFASIAAAGDVNINAIAPGIAAALVATVAGLFVAIPALFGYNYLITRIKDISAQMQVFLDAFVTRMAESYNTPDALHEMAAA